MSKNKFFATATLLTLFGLSTACKVSTPGKLETNFMRAAKHRAFVGNKEAKNPKPANAVNIKAGRAAFGHYCVVCHGLDGQATGVPFAAKMTPPVPSLASSDVQSYTDGQLQWIIENGIAPSGMPASKGVLNNDEIWMIVVYLRNLPPAGSLGEPKIYSQ
ncbi:MAG TPA: cytochrome c [Candidatus Koribacter sp.]|jgi:mono/diheme cytochrome c family protein